MTLHLKSAYLDHFAQWVAEARIPGAAVAVVHHGEIAVGCVGTADLAEGRPVTPETLFPLASVTKSFTALALMQQVAQGNLFLDAPVTAYFPWLRFATEGAVEHVTVRMLLSHLSGLGRTLHLDPQMGANFTSRRHLAESLVTAQLQSAPGAAWSYSNEAFSLAGHLVESVSGVPYEQYLTEAVLTPLGMTSSSPEIRVWQESPHAAIGYAIDNQGQVVPSARLPLAPASMPGGRISSTAPDMGRYLQALLDPAGNLPLEHSLLAHMHTPSAQFADTNWGYGLGWFIQHGPAHKVVRHGGNLPGTATHVYLVPSEQLGIAVLTNLSAAPAGHIAEQLADLILGCHVLRPTVQDRLPITTSYQADPARLAEGVGTYTSSLGEVTAQVVDDRMVYHQVPRVGAPATLDLLPVADDLFMVQRGPSEGQPTRFLRNREGRVDRLLLAGTLYTRS